MQKPNRKLPVWAVMCGALRRITEFKLSIVELLRLRDEGLIEGIVLSTWEGDLDKYVGLRDSLLAAGVILVESMPPPDTGYFNIYAQHKAFLEGLDACPAEVFIFKSRTDRSFELTWTFVEQMRVGLPEAEPAFGLDKCLEYKVGCLRFSTSLPFYIADFTFLAYHRDCRRLLNFDLLYDHFCMASPMFPEVRWFATPFLRESAYLARSFRELPLQEISMAILEHARSGSQEPLPNSLVNLLALSLAYVDGHFLTTRNDAAPVHVDPALLFRPQATPSPGVETVDGYMWSIVNSSRIVDDFLKKGGQSNSPYAAISSRCSDGLGELAQSIPASSDLQAVNAFVNRWAGGQENKSHATPCQSKSFHPNISVRHEDAEVLLAPWKDLEITIEEYRSFSSTIKQLAGGHGVGPALREEGKRLIEQSLSAAERRCGLRFLITAADMLDFDACIYLAQFYQGAGDNASGLEFGKSALAIASRSISWRAAEAQALLDSWRI